MFGSKKQEAKSIPSFDFEVWTKQAILDHLLSGDKLSEKTLMEMAGFNYENETKNRLVEAKNRKELMHVLQSPYEEKK